MGEHFGSEKNKHGGGALGEPSRDATPRGWINPSASDTIQNHSPNRNCLANGLISLDEKIGNNR